MSITRVQIKIGHGKRRLIIRNCNVETNVFRAQSPLLHKSPAIRGVLAVAQTHDFLRRQYYHYVLPVAVTRRAHVGEGRCNTLWRSRARERTRCNTCNYRTHRFRFTMGYALP